MVPAGIFRQQQPNYFVRCRIKLEKQHQIKWNRVETGPNRTKPDREPKRLESRNGPRVETARQPETAQEPKRPKRRNGPTAETAREPTQPENQIGSNSETARKPKQHENRKGPKAQPAENAGTY